MTKPPAISLLISVYNQRPLLEVVLPSVRAQQCAVPFEVLLCDDGSDDGVLEEVRRVVSTPAPALDVRYLWQPDRGFRLSRSRNNGVRCARGGILVFSDADTWLHPSFLTDHWDAHQHGPRLVCGTRQSTNLPPERRDEWGEMIQAALERPLGHEPHAQKRWAESSDPWMACLGGNFSVRRIEEVGFDERFEGWGSEDRDLAFRLYQAGLEPFLLSSIHAVQLTLGASTMRSFSHEALVASLKGKLLLKRKYPGGELDESLSLVRHCHLDPSTDRWSMGDIRPRRAIDGILAEFANWCERRGEAIPD